MTQQSSSKSKQGNTMSGASRETQNTASSATREVADQVKQTAGQVADQAQQAAGQLADQARQQVSSRLAGQKDRAAEALAGVAQALHQTGEQLRTQDQHAVTGYIDSMASQVERVSNYLERNDFGQLIDDVESFARRRPLLFLGGTFALGLLGARFLKSSRPYSRPAGYTNGGFSSQRQQPYSANYQGEPGFRGAGAAASYEAGTQPGSYTPASRAAPAQPSASGTRPHTYNQQSEKE